MRRFFIYGDSLDFDALMSRIEKLQDRVKKKIVNSARLLCQHTSPQNNPPERKRLFAKRIVLCDNLHQGQKMSVRGNKGW